MKTRSKVVTCCWQHAHQNEYMMSKKEEEKLIVKIQKHQVVCSHCMGPVFLKEGQTLLTTFKVYKCENNHVSIIGPLDHENLHVVFGSGPADYGNIRGTIEQVVDLIKDKHVTCKTCTLGLTAVDDATLEYVSVPGIKTRTRIGDLWDKNRVEPVRYGKYDSDGNFKESQTAIARREELRRNKRKRNIPIDRLPGKPIDKPTDRNYKP